MIKVFVPRENVNDTSVVVKALHVKAGELVVKGQLVVEIETSKTNVDIESPADGVINHALEVGSEIDIGKVLFTIGNQEDKSLELNEFERKAEGSELKISNAAFSRAKELGVDISIFKSGWITVADIEEKAGLNTATSIIESTPAIISNGNIELALPAKVETLSKRKQAEIRSIESGSHQSTSSTVGINIDVAARRIISPPYLFRESISDLIIFEGSKLLRQFPELNASYVSPKKLAKYEDVNFGFSFDNGSNLKVLAITKSSHLSLVEIQNEILRLLDVYESNQNIPSELLMSSTVTLSDLTNTESSFVFPLINGLQSLILGVVKQGDSSFSIYATFDHRVSEGFRVSLFLSELKKRILSHYIDNSSVADINCDACEKSIAEEIALGSRGFLTITLPNGNGAHLCRNCFMGW